MLVADHPKHILIQEAKAGNNSAWDALLRPLQSGLYNYLHAMTGNADESFDLLQNVFREALRGIGGLRQSDAFKGWLYGIAARQSHRYWKRRKAPALALEPLEDSLPGNAEQVPETLLLSSEDRQYVRAALETLPFEQRSCVLMHYMEGMSMEEIASALQSRANTVKTRLHLARQRLKILLKSLE